MPGQMNATQRAIARHVAKVDAALRDKDQHRAMELIDDELSDLLENDCFDLACDLVDALDDGRRLTVYLRDGIWALLFPYAGRSRVGATAGRVRE